MKPWRHDGPRRVTPELLAFHKANARRLREEAIRNAGRFLINWLAKFLRFR